MEVSILKYRDSDGDEMELIHNKYYDEYFLRVEDKFIEVNYEILNKFVDEFLRYNNYFED